MSDTIDTISRPPATVSEARLRAVAARAALLEAERHLSLLQPTPTTPQQPAANSVEVRRAPAVTTTWRHILPAEYPWDVALDNAYWRNTCAKLSVGDVVEVYTADFSRAYALLIQEVVDLVEYCRFSARPLFPHDLRLPEQWPESGDRPRYSMRPNLRDSGVFDVVDTVTGKVVKEMLARSRAADLCYEHNTADREARMLSAKQATEVTISEKTMARSRAAELAELGRGKDKDSLQ